MPFTETVNVRVTTLFDEAPSSTRTVIVTVPKAPCTGVSVSDPVAAGLEYVTAGAGITEGSLDDAVIEIVWFSFVAPAVIPVSGTVWAGEFSISEILPSGSIVGASFTGLIETVKVRVVILLEAPPSLKVTES